MKSGRRAVAGAVGAVAGRGRSLQSALAMDEELSLESGHPLRARWRTAGAALCKQTDGVCMLYTVSAV